MSALPTLEAAARVVVDDYDLRPLTRMVIPESKGFSGDPLWQVEAADQRWALRRYFGDARRCARLRYSQQVICYAAAAQSGGLALPRRARTGQTLLPESDGAWELSNWLPGRADFNLQPSRLRLRSAITALAQFHRATAPLFSAIGESRGVRERLDKLAWMPQTLEEISAAFNKSPALEDPSLKPLGRKLWEQTRRAGNVMRWAGSFPKAEDWRLQPILADVWHDNVLFEGERCTGLIDYTAIRHDSITIDLARLLGSLRLEGEIPWRLGLETYREFCELSSREEEILRWLHRTGLVIAALHWLEWIFVHRRPFDCWTAVKHRLQTIAEDLDRWVI